MSIKEPLLNFWYRALHSPMGIELIVSDLKSIREKLYAARKESQDSDLDQISACQSPFDPMRLWLVKRKSSDEKT